MPFPSTLPIHPDWSSHHQPSVTATLTGRVVISTPGESNWSPTGGAVAGTVGSTVYDGPFRVQELQGQTNRAVDVAMQSVTARPYLLVVPADTAEVAIGSVAKVHGCPDDANLVDKTLTVVSVGYGSRRFERDLFAELDLSNQAGVA